MKPSMRKVRAGFAHRLSRVLDTRRFWQRQEHRLQELYAMQVIRDVQTRSHNKVECGLALDAEVALVKKDREGLNEVLQLWKQLQEQKNGKD